jgi:hypothetical protein
LERDFGQAYVYRNRGFLPRAFLVHRAVVAASDSAAVELMKHADFDPATTVVLHEGEPLRADSVAAGERGERVEIERDDPGEVVLRVVAASAGYVFYSGNYLPYWKAYVDGREVPVVRCNVAMRAVYVEPGDHTLVMRYVSPWYRIGAGVCLVCWLVVGLSVFVSVKLRKGKRGRA